MSWRYKRNKPRSRKCEVKSVECKVLSSFRLFCCAARRIAREEALERKYEMKGTNVCHHKSGNNHYALRICFVEERQAVEEAEETGELRLGSKEARRQLKREQKKAQKRANREHLENQRLQKERAKAIADKRYEERRRKQERERLKREKEEKRKQEERNKNVSGQVHHCADYQELMLVMRCA